MRHTPSVALVAPQQRSCAGAPRGLPGLHPGPAFALAGIVGLAALLRFALLGHNSLWFDEAYALWITRLPWRDIPTQLARIEAHPPLYFLLMKAWTGVFGTSEASIRIPSAAFGLASVALTYILARRLFAESGALLAAFLIGVSPLQVMVSQDARMYALLGMLALAATVALDAMVREGGLARWILYVLLAAAMLYTHYLGLPVLAGHGVWIVLFERRSLPRWLAAMAATAALFAPWMPAFWYQTIHGHGWPWYRRNTTVVDLADLLGLYAFGGSLFGMGSYFFPGALAPAGQVVVLLPFIALFGWGAWRFVREAPERRSVGLLAAVLLTPVGAMTALAVGRHLFYPRWLAFLSPFFATIIAVSVVDLAERLGAFRKEALACLTLGLLVYNLPVLDRYYFDPTFRAYRWREAAALVARLSQPNDVIVFVNSASEIAFTYYMPGGHPSLTLTPTEDPTGTVRQPTFTSAQARDLSRRYPRMWLIATPPFTAEMQQRLDAALLSAYRVVGAREFRGIWVDLLEAKSR